MIVADTNIISYLLLPTERSDSADAIYQADPDWVAPLLWKSEFRSVLALYLRKQIITLDKALLLQESAESMMADSEFELPSPQVLALINQSSCSAYDCEFVALAQHLNIPLVTEDKKILREFPSTAINIDHFLSRNPTKPD
ncbi:MAG: type II toxin-antitoxin system VapC family toxin [Immundisolibacteraceae bacterium]|nr:type II toxin-antitoxin system VapC family toxin [Immundisolibacteraceae bacterium]